MTKLQNVKILIYSNNVNEMTFCLCELCENLCELCV